MDFRWGRIPRLREPAAVPLRIRLSDSAGHPLKASFIQPLVLERLTPTWEHAHATSHGRPARGHFKGGAISRSRHESYFWGIAWAALTWRGGSADEPSAKTKRLNVTWAEFGMAEAATVTAHSMVCSGAKAGGVSAPCPPPTELGIPPLCHRYPKNIQARAPLSGC
jgi:hypothetical protein